MRSGSHADAILRDAEDRAARVAALFSASARVDLEALVVARSLNGGGRAAAPALNQRFAFATVQQTLQSNRRDQVATLWAAHQAAGGNRADVGRAAPRDEESWHALRAAGAARAAASERALAAARREEDEQDAAEAADERGASAREIAAVLARPVRGRGGVGAAALDETGAGCASESSGSEGRRRRREGASTGPKRKHKKKKHKSRKEKTRSRSRSRS